MSLPHGFRSDFRQVYTQRYTPEQADVGHMSPAPTRQLLARPERQAAILRGAASAFARSGFAATSMEDVAAACEVTKLIVYRHFDSKEDLYRTILERVFHRMGEELERGLLQP